jgi:hypothetical protein
MALKILSVAGARPSMMKLAAISDAINAFNARAVRQQFSTSWSISGKILIATALIGISMT